MSRRPRRALLVPEVMQSSLMDCGPAALKAVLEGFGIDVNYDALRERCETDVDGTSIDALAMLGRSFGLETDEVLVSRDSFLVPEARCLPAIVVTRAGGGSLHFIVVWSVWGPFVQLMDPGGGRRWMRKRQFLELMPDIPIPISKEKWRRWAGSENSLAPLRARMRALGVDRRSGNALLVRAGRDASYRSFATLDAGLRMVATLVESRALRRGSEAARLLENLCQAVPSKDSVSIPKRFWWATEDAATSSKLVVRGSVFVHFAKRSLESAPPREDAPQLARAETELQAQQGVGTADRCVKPAPALEASELWPRAALPESLERDLAASKPPGPMAALWQIIHFASRGELRSIVIALLASALVVPAEAVLLRGLLTVSRYLALDYQRVAGIVAVLMLIAAGLWLELWAVVAIRRLGLGLETRVRVGFLEKLPRLEDKYLRSRPSSDMAGRGHAMHVLRDIPVLWGQAVRALLTLLATAAGLIWLFPQGASLTLLLTLTALVVPLLIGRSLAESNTRLRTHASALERFYLDALLGVSPVRVHGAERAVRCEHEALLTEWGRTARSLHLQGTGLQALQLVVNTGIAAALITAYVKSGAEVSGLLLLAYWALRMPSAAQELAVAQLALRPLRSVALRLLAPLAAPEAESASNAPAAANGAAHAEASSVGGAVEPRGVHLTLERVAVRVGGHSLLQEMSTEIRPGDHVAIVGTSGAGKSSLVGLFLGWFAASEGSVRVDGEPLSPQRLTRLREETAWVDPAVRLWDRSLYDNLAFGSDRDPQRTLASAMAGADLLEVLGQLPEGLQANLGEGGIRVSGGQGQRVRIARALMRTDARLVILDEPFRGLERKRRQQLLRRVREHWRHATLLFVSHDLEDTLGFERVLVLEAGRIVEDGAPGVLYANASSRYAELTRSDQALRGGLWSAAQWRRQTIDKQRLWETERP